MARPWASDSDRRTREFLRLLVELGDFADAAAAAGVDPGRVLRLLREPSFAQVAVAVLEGRVTVPAELAAA